MCRHSTTVNANLNLDTAAHIQQLSSPDKHDKSWTSNTFLHHLYLNTILLLIFSLHASSHRNEACCEWVLTVMFLGGIHRLHLSESRTSLMNEIRRCAFVMAVSRALAEASRVPPPVCLDLVAVQTRKKKKSC